MTSAYTVYWASWRCQRAKAVVSAGDPLEVLFASGHLSAPSFHGRGVSVGDLIYPITARSQVLYVLGRMRVKGIIKFLRKDPRTGLSPRQALLRYVERLPQWRFLVDSCTYEVVVGTQGTPIRLDAAMPPEVLKRLTYHSPRGIRTVKDVSDDGALRRSTAVQGIYKLTEPSVADLDTILTTTAVDQLRGGDHLR